MSDSKGAPRPDLSPEMTKEICTHFWAVLRALRGGDSSLYERRHQVSNELISVLGTQMFMLLEAAAEGSVDSERVLAVIHDLLSRKTANTTGSEQAGAGGRQTPKRASRETLLEL